MIIHNNLVKELVYNDIKHGEVFSFCGIPDKFYIKTKLNNGADTAINLETGIEILNHIGGLEPIRKINISMTLSEFSSQNE